MKRAKKIKTTSDDLINRKAIPGFPGYFITKTGHILSTRTDKGFSKKWLKLEPSGHNLNYFSVRLCKNSKSYGKQVHRLVLEAYVGKCPDGMEACHNNGNGQDNRLDNLRWDTRSSNAKDAVRHGTSPGLLAKGEKCGRAKLHTEDVYKIRYLWQTNRYTQREIANIYNISQPNVVAIVKKKSWKHLRD